MNAIEKLKEERQRMVERLAEIDKILGQYEELQRAAEGYFAADVQHTPPADSNLNAFRMPSPQEPVANPVSPTMPGVRKAKTPKPLFERAVLEILAAAERPLDRSALYGTLRGRGVVIGSPDESSDLNTLSARMSRMKDKIINVTGYGYWLKERPFLPGGYNPEGETEQEGLDMESGEDLI